MIGPVPRLCGSQPWSPDDHVFLAHAGELGRVDEEVRGVIGPDDFADLLAEVPDEWLEPVPGAETPDAVRAAYVEFLAARLESRQWLPQVVS